MVTVVGPWDAQATLDDLLAAQAANTSHASVDALSAAMRAKLTVLASAPEFLSWVQDNPAFKPGLLSLSGLLSTQQGVRHVTILLDSGAMLHLCAPGGGAQPAAVWPARPALRDDSVRGGAGTGVVHLSLGDAFRKYLSIPPMDMDVGGDLILGLDWISSRDLQYLFQACQAGLRSGPAQLQLALLPSARFRCAPAHSDPLHGDRA